MFTNSLSLGGKAGVSWRATALGIVCRGDLCHSVWEVTSPSPPALTPYELILKDAGHGKKAALVKAAV